MTYNAEISYTQDTIQHFGIKGMRWGYRNRKEYLTNSISKSEIGNRSRKLLN